MKKLPKDYSEAIPKAVELHIKEKYKCSTYLAKQITNELIDGKNN